MVWLWVVLELIPPRQPHVFHMHQYQFRGGGEDSILGSGAATRLSGEIAV